MIADVRKTRKEKDNLWDDQPPPLPPHIEMEGLSPPPSPLDTDRDGMPDEWEKKNGLDPAKGDAAKVMLGGVMAIEVYVDEQGDALVKGPVPANDPWKEEAS